MKIHKRIIYYIMSKLLSASESMWQSGNHHYPRFDQNALMNQNRRWIYTCLDLRAMTAVKTALRVFATKRKGENLLPKTRAVPKGLLNKLQEKAHLNRWVGKDVEIEEIVDDNNALYRLVNNFNPRDTRASIITIMMEQLDLVGNSYFVIEWNKALRVPEALWPTYPQHMTALVGKGKDKDAITGYEYRRGADTTTYRPEEILHIKAPDPNNLVYGTGILEKIVDTLILDSEMYEHAKAIFRNQGSPSMLFTPEGEPVAPDQQKRIDTDLKQNFGGSRKAGVVGFMNEKLKYCQFNFTEDDHRRLTDHLKDINGKFILSYNDDPMVKDLYRNFDIINTDPVLYSMNNRERNKRKKVSEIIIKNY